MAEAAAAAVAGKTADAVRFFGEAIDLWTEASTPLELMTLKATFAKMVGQEHPEARDASVAARDWIVGHGFGLFEELLAEALPPVAPEAATG